MAREIAADQFSRRQVLTNQRQHAIFAGEPMDADKQTRKLLQNAQKEFASLLDKYKQGDFDKNSIKNNRETIAFLIASTLGRVRRFGETEWIDLPDPKSLAANSFLAIKRMDFVEQYRQLEKDFSSKDHPLSFDDAVKFLNNRDSAQLAWLTIQNELDPPSESNSSIHKARFELIHRVMQVEDDFFSRLVWIFFEAAPWLVDQKECFSENADMAQFPWFWVIPEAASDAWNMPLIIPERLKVSDNSQEESVAKIYDFGFIKEAFGKGLVPPIENPTHHQIIERLSISKLAAEAPLTSEDHNQAMQSQMESFIQLLEPIRIRPKRGLPGFIITLSRAPAIDFSFQDAQCLPYSQFEGAVVIVGDKEAKIENGFASIPYDMIRSLYEDLSMLDDKLMIRFPDGTEKTRFIPDPS